MNTTINTYLFSFFLLLTCIVNAQNDTIQLKNDNVLVGEIKSFSKGILIMETSYSDKDFRIEFNKIESIVIQRKCLVILTNGRRRFGKLSTNVDGQAVITLEDGTKEKFKLEEIVALEEIKDNFWNRFTGAIDLSFSLSKANSFEQYNIGGNLNYVDELWLVKGSMSLLNSKQDDAETTKRNDAKLEFYRLLPSSLYLIGEVSFLANTEQEIEGRLSPSIGAGKFLIITNNLYLGLSVGYAYNIENYLDSSFNKTSSEAFIRGSFSMFDFEDISLDSNINFSPSLSEKGRIRTDYDIDLKYDLPLDFYIKLGFTINYDNQPVSIGNEVDYIFTSGFGWSFD
ncbi:DUF481 domain-containing protein [Psychroserpens jangbogonensis]|uniref:DUF481 domain-containing protein n=1 Tax=Psychroserpens jangbogonensis TaxID=1484460 RepID=UPI00068C97B5|nr:DUF481 domain-containing protein [Psychroserpens jangbogonensis]